MRTLSALNITFVTLSTTNLTRTGPGMEQRLRGEWPAFNRLNSQTTDIICCMELVMYVACSLLHESEYNHSLLYGVSNIACRSNLLHELCMHI